MTSSGGEFFEKARRSMPQMPAVVPDEDLELDEDEEHPPAEAAEPAPVQDAFDEQETVVGFAVAAAPPPRLELIEEVTPPATLGQADHASPPPSLGVADDHDDPS